MKIEKTTLDGYPYIKITYASGITSHVRESDFQSLRECIVGEVTDEVIDNAFPLRIERTNSERSRDKARQKRKGAKWLRDYLIKGEGK